MFVFVQVSQYRFIIITQVELQYVENWTISPITVNDKYMAMEVIVPVGTGTFS